MTTLLQDVRFAFRSLAKNPGFAAVAILTLALGIGANSSIFSIINATVLRRLPYPDPGRLMLSRIVGTGDFKTVPWSYPKFETLKQLNRDFESLAGFDVEDMNLTGGTGPERVRVETVSAEYFPILGARAQEGRVFTADEDRVPARNPVAVISHGLWLRRFGGQKSVIGTRIVVNDVPLVVVGVMAPQFESLSGPVDVWVPMMMVPALAYPQALQERWSHWLEVVGRLKNDVAPQAAAAHMVEIGRQVDSAHARGHEAGAWSAEALLVSEARSDPGMRKSLVVLLGAVAFVLLIACANVANLLLARATTRHREIAIRLAMGAGRGRLVRQLLTESMVLALTGGLVALLLTSWTTQLLGAIRPERTASWGIQGVELLDLSHIAVDLRVLLFTLALSIATGLLFGLVPALGVSRPDVTRLFRDSNDSYLGLRRLLRLNGRMLLATAEVCMALVLLVGAGLMLRSFARLISIDPGFDASSIVTFRLDPSPNKYNRQNSPDLHRRIVERISRLPGVESVAVNKCTPLSRACNGSVVLRVDGVAPPEGKEPAIGVHFANPDYFRTLKIPVLQGRVFTDRDRGEAPRVVILNRTAARQLWPDGDALGRKIGVGTAYFPDDSQAEVVGIVGDVRYGLLEEPLMPDVYIPDFQYSSPPISVMVKTNRAAGAIVTEIRREILAIDRDLPLFDVKTMEERVDNATSKSRFAAALLVVFAGIALTLAVIGIYGVMAFLVRQRTREIGVRMAMGARSKDVLADVLKQALTVTVAGVLFGIAGSLVLTRAMSALLYEITPRDPLTFVVVPLLLIAAGVVASYVPALRAARVEPMNALRYE
jgi:putative ABC transport system permease protein